MDRGKQNYWEKILSQCYFIHHKFHIDRRVFEAGSPLIETGPTAWFLEAYITDMAAVRTESGRNTSATLCYHILNAEIETVFQMVLEAACINSEKL
jgi:hypothetical protein